MTDKTCIPKVSVLLPCWARAIRTRRAIHSVIDQTIEAWELCVVGDGCPNIQGLIDSCAYSDDPRIQITNLPTTEPHKYGGGKAINKAVQMASGEYVVWLSNDDYFFPDHLEVRLKAITGTGHDMAFAPTLVNTRQGRIIRSPNIAYGGVGHSELITTKSLAAKHPHGDFYGHDWDFIERALKGGASHKLRADLPATIVVTHVPGKDTWDCFD
jgi:glycosyltransferase involved in cell wall biosynthesis